MATRVILNGDQGMRLHSKAPSILSDDDDGVQSGSATGFSDEMEDTSRQDIVKKRNMAFDPVTQILDKIDAELSSLTRSQGSSTATDSTVVRRPTSHMSTESSSRLDNGDSLTMSQLGSTNKAQFSPLSSGSRAPGSIDRDTGIGTATSSFTNDSRRSRSADERRPLELEPGDAFKDRPMRSISPDYSFYNGHHIGQSDDDKSKRENQTGSPFEAKQVDDKFKEIMQKRKGGYLGRAGTDDDNQTIRTEDFVEKFQDTMVYSSADEAERLKNLEDDLHSDGGSDTDTLQQKLATLTRTSLPKKDGRCSPCPLPRPLDRPRRKVTQSLDGKPRKVSGPGTPPVYPKPTPTSSLPRPSTRSSLKITPGHGSDADSVRTEDFEHRFKDMMIGKGDNTGESDLDPGTSDPIHTKVKQLLKATAKYKPKPDFKNKPHVRISPKPPQYQNQDKGEDSDDTLCSDKEARVTSPRSWSGYFHLPNPNGPSVTYDYSTRQKIRDIPGVYSQVSNASSLEESSQSLSQSSFSSSDKERHSLGNCHNDTSKSRFVNENKPYGYDQSWQASQISSAESVSSFSDCLDNSHNNSRSESTSESLADDSDPYSQHTFYMRAGERRNFFPGYQSSQFAGALRRKSLTNSFTFGPYKKLASENMKHEKIRENKTRDLIVQDEEEEEFPFSRYTFNKKTNSSNHSEDSSSNMSSVSQRSVSRDSICSTGVLNQLLHLKKGRKQLTNRSSSRSIFSSLTSSVNDYSVSSEDFPRFHDNSCFDIRQSQHPDLQSQYSYPHFSSQNSFSQDRAVGMSGFRMPSSEYIPPTAGYDSANVEQVLNKLGFSDSHNLVPERFLKSLMDKMYLSKHEEYNRQMNTPLSQAVYGNDHGTYVDDHDLPPSVSAQQSGSSTPWWRQSVENVHMAYPTDKKPHNKRYQLQRASTIHNSSSFNFSNSSTRNSMKSTEESDSVFSHVDPLPLQKENSFDKLKRILQSKDKVQPRERDTRRSAFVSNRQKSLPLFLATLSEEEEEKWRPITPSIDKGRGSAIADSNLLTPHDDTDHCSRSSEDNSDISRRSSINKSASVTETLVSVSKSLSNIGKDNETSRKRDLALRTVDDITVDITRDLKQTIPSIYVSGKDIDKESVSEMDFHVSDTETEQMVRTDKKQARSSMFPTPETNVDDTTCTSKDSLEIAEILSPKVKNVPYISILCKIDSFSEDESKRKAHDKNAQYSKQDDSNRYLKISEFEDKYLSPTPSTASPISPLTVIEMNKLDNQNEPVDIDDVYKLNTTETGSNVRLNTRTGDIHSNGTSADQRKKGLKTKIKSNSPHSETSLALERCSYYADASSDSDKNFSEENLEVDCNKAYDEKSAQADLEPLAPLLNLSQVSNMLEHLIRKIPQGIDNNMFFLAQDKEVQCDLLKSCQCDTNNCEKVTSEIQRDGINIENGNIRREMSLPKQRNSFSHVHSESVFTSKAEISPSYQVKQNLGFSYDNKTAKDVGEISSPLVTSYQSSNCESNQYTRDVRYKSEAFIFLKHATSETAERNNKKSHPTKTVSFEKSASKMKTNSGESVIRNGLNLEGTLSKVRFCKVVTDESVDENDNPDKSFEAEGKGFEEIVKSYVTYCKQEILESTGEVKSPNSLQVERFEYETWDSFDLKKVIDILGNKDVTNGIKNDDFDNTNKTDVDNTGIIETGDSKSEQSLQTKHPVVLIDHEKTMPYRCNETDKNVCHSDINTGVENFKVNYDACGRSRALQTVYCNKSDVSCEDDCDILGYTGQAAVFTDRDKATQSHSHEGNKAAHRYDMFGEARETAIAEAEASLSGKTFTSTTKIVLQGMSEESRNELSDINNKTTGLKEQITKQKLVIANGGSDNNKFHMKEYCFDEYNPDSVRSTLYIDPVTSVIHVNTDSVNKNSREKITDNDVEDNYTIADNLTQSKVGTGAVSKITVDLFSKESGATKHIVANGVSVSALAAQSFDSAATTDSSRTMYDSTAETVKTISDTAKAEQWTSDECANTDNEIHEHFEEMEEAYQIPKELLENKKDDGSIADKLSSRSLDFDKVDTRRHILKRCSGTAFSRSFDLLGSFFENEMEDDMSLRRVPKTTVGKNKASKTSILSVAMGNRHDDGDNSQKENEMINKSKPMSKELPEGNCQYQLGVKHDEDCDVVDVYSRVRVVKQDSDISDEKIDDIHRKYDQFSDVEESLQELENTQCLQQNVFDMFAQIDEEAGGKIETDKTLQEFEKLYRLSVDDDYVYQDKSNNIVTYESTNRRQSFGSILEELDHEIRLMESYHERFQFYETHSCKNCGHSITITTTEETQGQIEHDFCRECSPLDMTAEMLEKRRIQKMQKAPDLLTY